MSLLDYIRDLGVWFNGGRKPKNFFIDILEAKEVLDDKVCVFGNLDTVNVLWKGGENSITGEVRMQLQAVAGGGFIISNGSPIAPGTMAKT